MLDILDAAVKGNQGGSGSTPPVANSSTAAKAAGGGNDILSAAIQGNKERPIPVKPVPPATPVDLTPKAPITTSAETTPQTMQPFTFRDALNNLGKAAGAAWDLTSGVAKALLDSEIKPSQEELALEKNLPKPENSFLKVATAIPNFATKVVSRLIQPAMKPFSEDVAAAVAAPAFAEEVAAGRMKISDFEAKFPALQKSNLQVISDTAMAALTVYTPELFAGSLSKAATAGVVDALKLGALNGATAGALFGTTQILSSGEKDPKKIAEIYAKNIIGAAFLGGITHATFPIAKESFNKVTKDVVKTYGIPEHVYIDAAKVKDLFQTGRLTTAEEQTLIGALGLTPEQYRKAFTEGLSIEIPAQNVTAITDKPYWAQIKDTFGFKPTNDVIRATPTPQVSEKISNPARLLPSPEDISAELAKGKSAAQVTHELAKDMPLSEAQKAVEEAQKVSAKVEEPKPEPGAQVPTELPKAVDESVLNKTPAEYQQDFASVQNTHDEKVQALETKVSELEAKVKSAAPQSVEKKNLKVELSQAKSELQTLKDTHVSGAAEHGTAFSDFVQKHLETTHGIHPDVSRELAGKVAEHISEPSLVEKHGNTSLREIASNVAADHRAANPLVRGDKVITTDGATGKIVRPTRMEDGKRGYVVETKKGVTRNVAESGLKKAPSQKEVIKEAVAKKGSAKAGEIAKDTKILEPNVRRILGIGAKEGEFERVSDGVYKVKTPEGKEVAFVIPGDAIKELPRLAAEGFKADMVFLDIPYKTKAVSGGNRGVEYNLIAPAEFNHVLRAVNTIVKDDNSAVLYMFSQAKSGIEEMGKYTSLFEHYGFKPVARGEWQKLFQNGKPVTNVRGKVAEPEGIILFNKTGVMPEGKETPNLAFKLVRPKGYQTEKPAEMLKALIEMTTKEGETVLDPFAGSGVSAAEAVKAGRKAVAIEKNPAQAKKIAERAQKAANETKLKDFEAQKKANIASPQWKGVSKTEGAKLLTQYAKEGLMPEIVYHGTSDGFIANKIRREGAQDPSGAGVYVADYNTAASDIYYGGGNRNAVVAFAVRDGAEPLPKLPVGADGQEIVGGDNKFDRYAPSDLIPLPKEIVSDSELETHLLDLAEQGTEVSKDKVHASAIPEDKEKVPREPKPKVEGEPKKPEPKKELDPKELYEAERAIEQNQPRGYAATVFKEIATWFNPVGQAPSAAVDVIMRNKGEYERILFRTERAMKEIKNMWDKHSPTVALDFMDKIERGDFANIPEEFQDLALMYRERLDNLYAAVQQFKSVPFLENYFPRLWKDPAVVEKANIWAKSNARRPFQGNKSFTKHRIFATIKDGIDAGYELATHNPEELVQLHEQNVQKFLMANRIMDDLKARGFSKLVKSGGKNKIPDGFERINDSISKVYLNPNIPILEAYDEHVFNALGDVIESLGLQHDRKYDIGARGALGFTQNKTNTITTKFGTPLSVIAHELGHQLDYKYGLKELFKSDPDRTFGSDTDYTQKELRKLADLRYEGHDVTDSYKQYVRSAPEKMAVMLEAYVHAPERFKEVAPRTFEKFTEFLSKHAELRPILEIKPSLVYGVREDSIYAGGMVLGGEYWVQGDVARLLNNYLSPDHIMDTALGRGVMNVKNTMNALELGFSAFHLTMETFDTMITDFSIGLTKVAHGDFAGFKKMLTAPVTPISYFNAGRKFYNGDPQLLQIEKDLFTGGASLREKQYYKNTMLETFMKENRAILGLFTGDHVKEGNVFIQHDKNIPLAVKKAAINVLRLPLAAVEVTMRPLFTYYIPRLKVGAFRDLFAAELERNSARIQSGELTRENIARDVWNNIENRMGELNYDNLFWNRNLKTGLMLTTRAVGWNLGTVREIGGALFQDLPKSSWDAAHGKGFNFTPKMAYTLSLFFFVATAGAIYQFLHTGKKPSSVKDLFYPQNGATTAAGEPYRIEFPTYLKDIYQSGLPQLFTGHPFGAFDSFASMIKNKAAPELTALIDIMQNKDFYDNEIRNPHDNTTTQAKQLAVYLLSTLTPFTFQQQQNLAKGQSTTEQQIEAFFGIIKAPKEIIQSDYNARLAAIYQDQRGLHAPETPEQQDAYDKKQKVVEQIKKGDYSGIQKLVADGILKPSGIKTFIENALLTTPQKQYKYLSPQNKFKLSNDQ